MLVWLVLASHVRLLDELHAIFHLDSRWVVTSASFTSTVCYTSIFISLTRRTARCCVALPLELVLTEHPRSVILIGVLRIVPLDKRS